jgi:hypothetical protein
VFFKSNIKAVVHVEWIRGDPALENIEDRAGLHGIELNRVHDFRKIIEEDPTADCSAARSARISSLLGCQSICNFTYH